MSRRGLTIALTSLALTAAGCAGAPYAETEARAGRSADAAEPAAGEARAQAPAGGTRERSITLAEAIAAEAPGPTLQAAALSGPALTLHVDLGSRMSGRTRSEWAGVAIRASGRGFDAMAHDVGRCWAAGDRARPDPAPAATIVDPTDRLSAATTSPDAGTVMDRTARRVDVDFVKSCLSERGYAGVVLSQPPHETNGPFNPAPGSVARIARAIEASAAAAPVMPTLESGQGAERVMVAENVAADAPARAGPAVIGPQAPNGDVHVPYVAPAEPMTAPLRADGPAAPMMTAAAEAPKPAMAEVIEAPRARAAYAAAEPAPSPAAPPAAEPAIEIAMEAPGGAAAPPRAARAEPIPPQSAILAPELADTLIARRAPEPAPAAAAPPAPAPAPIEDSAPAPIAAPAEAPVEAPAPRIVARAEIAAAPPVDAVPALAGGPEAAPAPAPTPAAEDPFASLPTLDELLTERAGRAVSGREVDFVPLGE